MGGVDYDEFVATMIGLGLAANNSPTNVSPSRKGSPCVAPCRNSPSAPCASMLVANCDENVIAVVRLGAQLVGDFVVDYIVGVVAFTFTIVGGLVAGAKVPPKPPSFTGRCSFSRVAKFVGHPPKGIHHLPCAKTSSVVVCG